MRRGEDVAGFRVWRAGRWNFGCRGASPEQGGTADGGAESRQQQVLAPLHRGRRIDWRRRQSFGRAPRSRTGWWLRLRSDWGCSKLMAMTPGLNRSRSIRVQCAVAGICQLVTFRRCRCPARRCRVRRTPARGSGPVPVHGPMSSGSASPGHGEQQVRGAHMPVAGPTRDGAVACRESRGSPGVAWGIDRRVVRRCRPKA